MAYQLRRQVFDRGYILDDFWGLIRLDSSIYCVEIRSVINVTKPSPDNSFWISRCCNPWVYLKKGGKSHPSSLHFCRFCFQLAGQTALALSIKFCWQQTEKFHGLRLIFSVFSTYKFWFFLRISFCFWKNILKREVRGFIRVLFYITVLLVCVLFWLYLTNFDMLLNLFWKY